VDGVLKIMNAPRIGFAVDAAASTGAARRWDATAPDARIARHSRRDHPVVFSNVILPSATA
jgi:hypothetical protein